MANTVERDKVGCYCTHLGGDRIIEPCNVTLDIYLSISLTSMLLKVLEKIVKRQVVSCLSANSLLNPTQRGFREGRSFLSSALLEVYDNMLAYQSDSSTNVDMIYLDFAKAFNAVDH